MRKRHNLPAMTMIDTLSIARGLRDAGFSQQQAEALASAVRQAAGVPDISHLPTKSDLQAAIAEAKYDIIKWTISTMVALALANIGAMFALVKLLGH
jgi:hypothetical protein